MSCSYKSIISVWEVAYMHSQFIIRGRISDVI